MLVQTCRTRSCDVQSAYNAVSLQRGRFSRKYSQKTAHKGAVWIKHHIDILPISSYYLCNILQIWTAL